MGQSSLRSTVGRNSLRSIFRPFIIFSILVKFLSSTDLGNFFKKKVWKKETENFDEKNFRKKNLRNKLREIEEGNFASEQKNLGKIFLHPKQKKTQGKKIASKKQKNFGNFFNLGIFFYKNFAFTK